jgi:hypothetical protein
VTALRVGFRAFDPHELLVHFVAERAGAYTEFGLDVTLVDLRAGDRPHDAAVACGAALFAALDGAPIQVLLIASAAPLFWLYGRRRQLAGARIASYPPGAPPARFLTLALGETATLLPARDDAARLALLDSGAADCALLSSATPPSHVADTEQLFCLGDRVPVPTTGVAAPLGHRPEVDRLVQAHRLALRLLATDPALARATARDAFAFDEGEAAWAVSAARRYFTGDGRVPAAYIEAALAIVGAAASPYAPQAVSPP